MNITDLTSLTPPGLLLLVLFGLGRFIKASRVPNRLILILLPAAGAILYPFMGEWTDVVKSARIPVVTMCGYGFGIGMAATGAHQALLRIMPRFLPQWICDFVLGEDDEPAGPAPQSQQKKEPTDP